MFKKWLVSLALVLFSAMAGAQQWQEDVHYKVVKPKANAQAGVVEIFSYWCPACYNFEGLVATIKEKLPADVKFSKAHLDTTRFNTPEIQEAATRAMLVARAKRKEEAFNKLLFEEIHVNNNRIASADEMATLIEKAGVSKADYNKMYKSFGLNSGFKRNKKQIAGFSRVPTLLVNDKYQVIFTRDMTPDNIVELVVWLSEQP